MKIVNDCVVRLHFTLKDDLGRVIQSSWQTQPIEFIVGKGNVLVGIEESLLGKQKGDEYLLTVPPEKAYGEHDPRKVQQLPKDFFAEQEVRIGDQFNVRTETGVETLKIIDINGENIIIDYNHAMAGARLNFQLKVEAVRFASKEELEKGQIHSDECEHSNRIQLKQC